MGNPWAYDLTAIAARAAPLLIVVGSDADPAARKQGGYRVTGNSDVYKLLPDGFPFEQINLSKQFMRQRARPDLSRYSEVLNLVTDPDQHGQTLETLRKLLRGYRGRVINRPEAVLRSTRDLVAKRLAGIAGLRVPTSLRLRAKNAAIALQAAERSGICFPAILRQAGTHGGNIVGRVDSLDELRAGLGKQGDYLLTEFVDFRGADGLYRKYRFFFFGERTIFRHMIVSDQWDIHARERTRFMAERPEHLAEEARLFERPEGALPTAVHQVLHAVSEAMQLDLFGMDCGIAANGEVVLFEANATMNFFPFMDDPRFAHVERCLPPARAAFRELVSHS